MEGFLDRVRRRSAIAVIICAFIIFNLSFAAYAQSLGETSEDASRRIQPLLGKDMEAKSPISLSDRAQQGATTHPASGRFRIDSVESGDPSGNIWVHLTFAGGQDGYYRTTPARLAAYIYYPPFVANRGTYPSFIDKLPTKEAARRRELPGAVLGMTEAQALESAWGTPKRVSQIQRTYSNRICWYYPHQNVLCFKDNALVTIAK